MIPDIEAPGCTWGHYVERLAATHGGQAALVDLLIRRGSGVVDLPTDPQTIERALRRLAQRGNGDGGKYGRWLIRFFGVPDALAETARWMGQYHSRFADLPSSLRRSQLLLWDRPPICETAAGTWIHLGLASVAMRARDHGEAGARLQRARSEDIEAQLEAMLLEARLASEGDESSTLLARATALLPKLTRDVSAYAARVADQQAYRLLREDPPKLERARDLYASIPTDDPFAAFRRCHGLAYCAWKSGDVEVAIREAEAAADHAADAGLVRFRVQALKLHARILGGNDELRSRAERMARALEQEDLL